MPIVVNGSTGISRVDEHAATPTIDAAVTPVELKLVSLNALSL